MANQKTGITDTFECEINKNDTLSDIQKMNYLKNLVEDNGGTVISSIKLANQKYNICLNLLKERCEDKQLMIYSQICKILKLEKITQVQDVSGLKKLLDTIDIQVQSLKNFGHEPDRHEPLLIPIITSKLPDDLNLIISRKFDSADNWDIEIVLNALKTEIIAREKTALVSKQMKICEMNILESLLQALLCSAIRKNHQWCVYFVKRHTKARIVVLFLTDGQVKMLCEQVNFVLCD